MASNYSELVLQFTAGTQAARFASAPGAGEATVDDFKTEATRIKTAAAAIVLATQQEATQIISTKLEERQKATALELLRVGVEELNIEVGKVNTATDKIINETADQATWPAEIQAALASMEVIKNKTKEIYVLFNVVDMAKPEPGTEEVPTPDFEPEVAVPEKYEDKKIALEQITADTGALELNGKPAIEVYEAELLRIKKIARLYVTEAKEKATEVIRTSTLGEQDKNDQLARVTQHFTEIETHLNRIDEIYLGVHDTTTPEENYATVLGEARTEVDNILISIDDMILDANVAVLDFTTAFTDLVAAAQALADTRKSEAQQIIVTAPEINEGDKTEEFRKIEVSYNVAVNNIHSLEALKNSSEQVHTLAEKITTYKNALDIFVELSNTMAGAVNVARKFAGLKEEDLEYPFDPNHPAIKEEDINKPQKPIDPPKEDGGAVNPDRPGSDLTEEEISDQDGAYLWVDKVIKSEDYTAIEKIDIIRTKDVAPFNALIKRLDAYQNAMNLDKVVDPLKGARANFDLYTYLVKQLKQNYSQCKPLLDVICIYFSEADTFSAFRHTAMTRFDTQWEFGRDTLKEYLQLVTFISVLADLKERAKNRKRVSLVGSAIDRTIIDNITRYFEL